MPSVTATGLQTASISDDGSQLNLKFATKYVGELEVILPANAVEALRLAFNRLNPPAEQSTDPAARPSTTTFNAPGQVTVAVPKTWLVTADLSRQAVVIVFNHELETRTGYGLNADATQRLAAALSKNAAAVLENTGREGAGQRSAT